MPRQLIRILLAVFVSCLLFTSSCKDGLYSGNDSAQTAEVEDSPAGTQYHFNVFGDSRDGNYIYSYLIALSLTAGSPEFNVHLGDMISDYKSGNQWPIFMKLNRRLMEDSDFLPVIGNHDVKNQESLDRMRSMFSMLSEEGYYSRTVNTVFNIVLNGLELDYPSPALSETQFTWLESQLSSAEAQQAATIVVYSHHPPFPLYKHADNPLEDNERLHSLLLKYDVRLVFSGHEHSYSHQIKDGVHYVVSGGAGSPLHSQTETEAAFFHFVQVNVLDSKLVLRVYGLLGIKHDEFEITL